MLIGLKEIFDQLHNTLENNKSRSKLNLKDFLIGLMSWSPIQLVNFITEDVEKLELEKFINLNSDSSLNRDLLKIVFNYTFPIVLHIMDDSFPVKQLTWSSGESLNIKVYQDKVSYSVEFLENVIFIDFTGKNHCIDLCCKDSNMLSISFNTDYKTHKIEFQL